MYVRRCLVVLVCVQSTLRVATSSLLLDSHTWLVSWSHGGMGSPFDGSCRRYYGLTVVVCAAMDDHTRQVETAWCMQVDFIMAAFLSWWDG